MKRIVVNNESVVLDILKEGRGVKGRLKMEKTVCGKCVISFKAYNCNGRRRCPDKFLLALEHGWVKESKQRVKLYESLPKAIGAARMTEVLKREMKSASELIKNHNVNLN